ncbi:MULTISPECIES: hypothetical protein [unclassified Sutcliffiella]|uniref:hypothetical protein n=1 Tax=unclassified Sutcliffiella TaxID=2837532 RepID=UPI0030CD44AA
MNKQLLAVLIFGGIIALGMGVFYFFSVPKEFYTEEELLENYYHVTPEMKFQIQDIVQLDEKTYIVLHHSYGDKYGSSVWVWRMGKWDNVGSSSSTGPQILNNNGNSYVYWNLDPDDIAQKVEIFVTSRRNYSITNSGASDRKEVYYPQIQVKHEIELGEKSYGYAKLPSQWKELTGSFDVSPADNGILPSSHYFTYQYQALNDKGEAISLEHTHRNGGGGSYSGDYVIFMGPVQSGDLE